MRRAASRRPLGVLVSSRTRLAAMLPVRPWRAAVFGRCARLLRLAPQGAPQGAPQELRSPRSLRGKQRERAWPSEPPSRHPTWRWAAVAMWRVGSHRGLPSQQPWAMGCAARLEAARPCPCTVVRWTEETGAGADDRWRAPSLGRTRVPQVRVGLQRERQLLAGRHQSAF